MGVLVFENLLRLLVLVLVVLSPVVITVCVLSDLLLGRSSSFVLFVLSNQVNPKEHLGLI